MQTIWFWYFLVSGPKSILSVEGIKRHSKSEYIINSALVNLLTFWKLPYSISSGSETDFVLLIARQIFKQHCNTPELEKHCKKYQKKVF